MKNALQLPEDYAIVLQQIDEDGGDNFSDLASSLNVPRQRLAQIIDGLQKKGLVILRSGYWLTLSRKGERLMQYMWPESRGLKPSY